MFLSTSGKGTMPILDVFTKIALSAIAALGMYWMRVPQPIIVLLLMMMLDIVTGSGTAFILGEFNIRKLGRGIMLKAMAFPLLMACDLSEEPLDLHFHLDSYVAFALIAYEFLSIVENYSRVRPLPKVIVIAARKAQELLSVLPDQPVKVVETTVTERVESPEAPGTAASLTTITKTTTTKETVSEPLIVMPPEDHRKE